MTDDLAAAVETAIGYPLDTLAVTEASTWPTVSRCGRRLAIAIRRP